ncbi:MAG TPA: hypothetical protein VND99_05500 [Candidatus Acidoferrales bacterium]|nr:hypothetical protein [Candidatus Acidoferrales bacterium]
MAFSIGFNEEKNQLLKATRRVSFEDVIEALKERQLLADIAHPSLKHSQQRLYVVKIKKYAYAVPYISNERKQEIFLKTIYPSRILTKIYLKGGTNEKKK